MVAGEELLYTQGKIQCVALFPLTQKVSMNSG
nr:unnamed protein product [Callosobruchus analis]CAI5870127.1 unnamed protein product [Callosobruchus analis]